MSNYVNADTIPGHPLSGSGKQVPDHKTLPPHAQNFVAASKSGGFGGTEAENYYDIPGGIYVNNAEKYGLINVSGSAPVEFDLAKGYYRLQPTAWTGSAANGSIVFVYGHNG